MVSAETAGIIAAICAAGGALLGTMSTGMWTQRIEKFKRRKEEMDVSQKYRDPLLRASERLQSRIKQLCQQRLREVDVNHANINNAYSYDYSFTLFLFGQFFAWSLALENAVPTKHRQLSEEDLKVLNILYKIHRIIDDPEINETFRIYTGTQIAIGEVMTVKENGTAACMGYSDFISAWVSPLEPVSYSTREGRVDFRVWFEQIENGLEVLRKIPENFPPCRMAEEREQLALTQDQSRFPFVKLHRLIQLQHLLISLIFALDPDQRRGPQHLRDRIKAWDETDGFKCRCEMCSPSLPQSFPAATFAVRTTLNYQPTPSAIDWARAYSPYTNITSCLAGARVDAEPRRVPRQDNIAPLRREIV